MKNQLSHVAAAALVLVCCDSVYSQPPETMQGATANEQKLLSRIRELEQRLASIEARLPAVPASTLASGPAGSDPKAPVAPASGSAQDQHSATGDSLSLPGFASGTTVNLLLDGYYEYNFNRPTGRVNLLRAYDPSSNSFTVNQGAVVIERAPDAANGRRFGLRLDLMFGQATESLAGNPANEPRTAPYRNIFQAYGTYIAPVGKGLNVDFGRFASSLGMEGSFAKDQINYTRSLLFGALPFYHMGFRTSYKLSGSTTATWMLVNGANQMEDFNGFKSNYFMLATSLSKNVTWTANYYVGRESRDLAPAPVLPAPDGRTHIGDTYLTWNATPKLTLAGEADYILSRQYSNSAPTHLAGGAAYLKYQFVPAFSLAGRFEYVADHGFLSGATQSLKEGTITAAYQPADGFQVRWEFRHDHSNQPFFLSSIPGLVKKQQNTALLGLLWWFGGKQGSW